MWVARGQLGDHAAYAACMSIFCGAVGNQVASCRWARKSDHSHAGFNRNDVSMPRTFTAPVYGRVKPDERPVAGLACRTGRLGPHAAAGPVAGSLLADLVPAAVRPQMLLQPPSVRSQTRRGKFASSSTGPVSWEADLDRRRRCLDLRLLHDCYFAASCAPSAHRRHCIRPCIKPKLSTLTVCSTSRVAWTGRQRVPPRSGRAGARPRNLADQAQTKRLENRLMLVDAVELVRRVVHVKGGSPLADASRLPIPTRPAFHRPAQRFELARRE